jgi:radical SAM protein with 4Fe4S-binding SPASM domain
MSKLHFSRVYKPSAYNKKGYPYNLLNQLDILSINKCLSKANQNKSMPNFVLDKVEIMPTSVCNYRCNFCYGYYFKTKFGSSKKELPLKIIEGHILEDLRKAKIFLNQDPIIILGGLYSEPLAYSNIIQLIELLGKYHFRFAIYTNGFFLNDNLLKLICESSLSAKSLTPSYISFNITASFIHGDFQNLTKKIKKLVKLRNKIKPRLLINAPIIVSQINNEELKRISKVLLRIGVDAIRYSFPQKPIKPQPEFIIQKPLISLGGDKEKHVYFRSPSKPFNKCFVMTTSISIDPTGNVYPCSQTCHPYFKKLSFGSINKKKLSEIWRSDDHVKLFKTFNPQLTTCRCNIVDEQFNRICCNFY